MYGLPEEDFKSIVQEIKKNLGDTNSPKLYVYGSRVKGIARKFSGIDLLLKAESYDVKSLSQIDFSDLDTSYKVDFVLDEGLYDKYRDEIYSHMV